MLIDALEYLIRPLAFRRTVSGAKYVVDSRRAKPADLNVRASKQATEEAKNEWRRSQVVMVAPEQLTRNGMPLDGARCIGNDLKHANTRAFNFEAVWPDIIEILL